jgi:hypothetical protein
MLCNHGNLNRVVSDLYLAVSWPRSFSCGSGRSTRSGIGILVFKTGRRDRVLMWFIRMEHFSIAPHPKDFFFLLPTFALPFWVDRIVRHGGVGSDSVIGSATLYRKNHIHQPGRTVNQRGPCHTLPGHYLSLPTLTGFLATPAKTFGAFGLVVYCFTYPYRIRACDGEVIQVGLDRAAAGLPSLTILYRPPDLALPRP